MTFFLVIFAMYGFHQVWSSHCVNIVRNDLYDPCPVWPPPGTSFTRYDHGLLCCHITMRLCSPAGRLPSTGWRCCFRVTHPAGPSCRPPVGSAGSEEHWKEAGGETSFPAEAPDGTPTGRPGGTSCRPAGRRDAAAPLWKNKNKSKQIHNVYVSFALSTSENQKYSVIPI